MPTPPGFANVSLQLTLTGYNRPAYVTFGCDPTSTDGAIVGAAILTAYQAAGSLRTICDNAVTLTQIRVSMGTDGTADIPTVLPTSVAGTNTITSNPASVAALLRKNTALGGRRGRGRMFFPWCIDDAMVDERGAINSAVVTTLTNAGTAFVGALTTGNCSMFLLHRAGQTPTAAPTQVTSMTCDPIIGSQRRRLGR